MPPYFSFIILDDTSLFRFPNHILKSKALDQPQSASKESLLTRDVTVICATFSVSFSSKSKATNVFPKHILNSKAHDYSIQLRKSLFCHVIIKNYLCNVLCKYMIKAKSTWRCKIKEQIPLLTLLHCRKTVSMVHCFMFLKVQGLDCVTASGFRARVTVLVFCF